VLPVKRITRSISQKGLGERMGKPLSKSGPTSTLWPCPLGRWVLVLVILPSTIVGIGGIGRKYWEWVWLIRFPLQLADAQTAGDLLLRNLLKALSMKEKHTAINEKFNASFPKEVLLQWAEMISRWEQDKTAPNPYTHTEKGAFYCYYIM
jgi:hypothetical protein